MLAECYIGLPWSKYTDEQQLLKLKGSFTDDEYSKRLPAEFRLITQHLKTLKYDTRPNYKEIYDALMKGVKRLKIDFSSAYDWEDEKDLLELITTALSFSDSKMSKKPLTNLRFFTSILPMY
uniref:Uncharacterized protein n=1 Tax=Panagrolaimus davidi TaxID=227884 RepID=A0A914P5K0_9BILA